MNKIRPPKSGLEPKDGLGVKSGDNILIVVINCATTGTLHKYSIQRK